MPLIDVNKKIIFVHIFRTGGTTIRHLLRDRGINLQYLGNEHGFLSRVETVDFRVGTRIRDDYKVFSFVRNPYTWLFSIYRWIQIRKDHPYHQEVAQMTLEAFVLWFIQKCDEREYGRQVDFLTRFEYDIPALRKYSIDITGVEIFKHEDFLCSTNRMLKWLGLEEVPEIPVSNAGPPLNMNELADFQKTWKDSRVLAKVNKYFEADFDYLGYTQWPTHSD